MAPSTGSAQKFSAAGLLAAQLEKLPVIPSTEGQAPQLFVRVFAPELCDYWQVDDNTAPEETPFGLDLDLTLALKPPGGKPFSISRVLGLLLASLRQEGLEAEGFDLGRGPKEMSGLAAAEALPMAARGIEDRVDTALERTEVRSLYYSSLRSMAQSSLESMLRMRRDCMREIDRLRQEVSKLRRLVSKTNADGVADSGELPHCFADDVTFFSVEDFMPPSWMEILKALDYFRWKRVKPKTRDALAEWEASETRRALQQLEQVAWKQSQACRSQEDATDAETNVPISAADSVSRDGLVDDAAVAETSVPKRRTDSLRDRLDDEAADAETDVSTHATGFVGNRLVDSAVQTDEDGQKTRKHLAGNQTVNSWDRPDMCLGHVNEGGDAPLSIFPCWSPKRSPLTGTPSSRNSGTPSALNLGGHQVSDRGASLLCGFPQQVTPDASMHTPGLHLRKQSWCLQLQDSNHQRPRPSPLITPTGATSSTMGCFPGSVHAEGSSSNGLAICGPTKHTNTAARAMPALQETFVMMNSPAGLSGICVPVQWSPQNCVATQWSPQNAACVMTRCSCAKPTSPDAIQATQTRQPVTSVSLPSAFRGLRLSPMLSTAPALAPMLTAPVTVQRLGASGVGLPAVQPTALQQTVMSMVSPLAKSQIVYRKQTKNLTLPAVSKSIQAPSSSAPQHRRPASTMSARTHVRPET